MEPTRQSLWNDVTIARGLFVTLGPAGAPQLDPAR
jgi:sulfoxide reductase heme-binding subunit YedZ